MAKAKLVKQVLAVTENKVGLLADLCSAVSEAGVNIQAIKAYADNGEAKFRLLTDNNSKVKTTLQGKGYRVSDEEVVTVELANKVGALKQVADKFKARNIDLKYIYGSTCSAGCDCLLVLSSDNNSQAVQILNG